MIQCPGVSKAVKYYFKVWGLRWSQGYQCSLIMKVVIFLGDYLCFKAIPLQILSSRWVYACQRKVGNEGQRQIEI